MLLNLSFIRFLTDTWSPPVTPLVLYTLFHGQLKLRCFSLVLNHPSIIDTVSLNEALSVFVMPSSTERARLESAVSARFTQPTPNIDRV